MKELPIIKTKVQDVEEFLKKTGFILEMEVSELLIKKGYKVEVNTYFDDYDEDKRREIDIIANKKIGEITVFLIIECKQSLTDDWIFICSDKSPKRYFSYLKHTPEATNYNKTGIFDMFPSLDESIKYAQNYIIKDKSKKKSTSIQIDACLEKLPKALVHLVDSNNDRSIRKIYLPIAVFNGGIFTAEYNKKLNVKNTDWIQYESVFYSENYKYHHIPYRSGFLIAGSTYGMKDENVKENTLIAKTSQEIGYKYLIDFTTKKGLTSLINKIEFAIKKIDLEKWPIKV
jgi:hypothetical protein